MALINIRQRAIQGHRQEKRLIGSDDYCILAIYSKPQKKKKKNPVIFRSQVVKYWQFPNCQHIPVKSIFKISQNFTLL